MHGLHSASYHLEGQIVLQGKILPGVDESRLAAQMEKHGFFEVNGLNPSP